MGSRRSAGIPGDVPTGSARGAERSDPPRRSRRVRRVPVRARLAALPWVTIVLLGLVAAGVVGMLRPERFEARSTMVAETPTAAARAAGTLAGPDLAEDVAEQLELDPGWRGRLAISVERPADLSVVVRVEAPDPRLAAVAADTAAAVVVQDNTDLDLTVPAAVPTRPVDGGAPGLWLGGGAALLLAILVERARDRTLVAGETP